MPPTFMEFGSAFTTDGLRLYHRGRPVLLGRVVKSWVSIGLGAVSGIGAGLFLTGLEVVALQPGDREVPLAMALGGIILAGGLLAGAALGLLFWLLRWCGETMARRVAPGRSALCTGMLLGALASPGLYLLVAELARGRQAAKLIGAMPARLGLIALLVIGLVLALWLGLRLAPVLARSRWRALVAASLLLLVSAALFYVDARMYRRLYGYIHALALGGSFVAAQLAWLALAQTFGRADFPRRRIWIPVVVAALVLGAGGWGRATLQREQRLRFAALELATVTTKLLALVPLGRQAEDPNFLQDGGGQRGGANAREDFQVPGANVVWVTIDALRPDHLGAYGYNRPTSPNIDALAARSTRFSLAYCQAPLTCYSVPSLHTGDYVKSTLPMGISPPPTLARILGARGYRTAAFYNASIFFCDDRRATAYGERRFDFQHAETTHRPAADLTDQVLAYLQKHRAAGEPRLFLWVHYFDVHEPYVRNEGFDFGPRELDRYDSGIALVDRALGRLVAALSSLKRPTIFVLTSDHGEEFREHGGSYHGSSLYEEQVRVPLLVGVPGIKPGVAAAPAQLVDVAPTMLKLLGVRVPGSMHGRSLVGDLLGRGDPERAAFSEVHTKKMARYRDWKLIHDFRRSTYELYDLRGDPGERRNLIGQRPRQAARLKALLTGWFDSLRAAVRGDAASGPPEGIDLGRIGDRRAVPLLGKLVLDPAVPTRWRREAAQLLGQMQDRAAAADLWGAVADDDLAVAAEAAIALGEMQDKRARQVLPDVLANTDDDVRMRASIAMARVQDPAASPALVETLYSQSWELQNRAAHYLGFLGDSQAVEPLLRAAGLGHLRSRVALALGRLGRRVRDRRILPFLLKLAQEDPKLDTRQRALAGLGYLGDRRASRPLSRLLTGGADLTWLPETLSRLDALGATVTGLDVAPARRGLRGAWGQCTRDTSQSAERYLASTWCAVAGKNVILEVRQRRRPKGGTLQLHLRPLGAGTTGQTRSVEVRLNGKALGSVGLSGGWQVVRLAAPARQWRRGINQVALVTQDLPRGAAAAEHLAVDYVLLAPSPAAVKNKAGSRRGG